MSKEKQIVEIQQALFTVAQQTSSLIYDVNKVINKCRRYGGQMDRIVGGQLEYYFLHQLEQWAQNGTYNFDRLNDVVDDEKQYIERFGEEEE